MCIFMSRSYQWSDMSFQIIFSSISRHLYWICPSFDKNFMLVMMWFDNNCKLNVWNLLKMLSFNWTMEGVFTFILYVKRLALIALTKLQNFTRKGNTCIPSSSSWATCWSPVCDFYIVWEVIPSTLKDMWMECMFYRICLFILKTFIKPGQFSLWSWFIMISVLILSLPISINSALWILSF